MIHFAFKKACALILIVAYSLVFVCCSPIEGTTSTSPTSSGRSNTPAGGVRSTYSLAGGYTEGNWAVPPGFSTAEIVLMVVGGVVIVVAVIVLLNRSSNAEKAVKSTSLDSVLTTPSSLGLASHRGNGGLIDSQFTLRLESDSAYTFIDGKASVRHEQHGWKSVLVFLNVVGVAEDSGGPFNLMSIEIGTGDVIYVKVNDNALYRVSVNRAIAGSAELLFEGL